MKKILGILLTFTMLLSCIGTVTVSADAEYVEASTVEDFKDVLESDGDKNIIVTRDIIYTCQVNDVGSYWITLGSGEKTLNLNGKSVELNAETGVETTMIRVSNGAKPMFVFIARRNDTLPSICLAIVDATNTASNSGRFISEILI